MGKRDEQLAEQLALDEHQLAKVRRLSEAALEAYVAWERGVAASLPRNELDALYAANWQAHVEFTAGVRPRHVLALLRRIGQ